MAKPPYELTKPPDGIGQITDLFISNCQQPLWVWVGAVGWGALVAFMSLLSPSWKDWVKWSTSTEFELRWSGIEGRNGRSWLHLGREIMEDAEELHPTAWRKKTIWIFELAEDLDLAAFWFAVGEAVSEGILASTSLVMQLPSCQKPVNYKAFFSKLDIGTLQAHRNWQPAGAWLGHGIGGLSDQLGPNIDIPKGATAELAYCLQYANAIGGEPVALNTRVIDLDTGDIYSKQDWNPEEADLKRSAFGRIKAFGPTTRSYHMQVQAQIVGTLPRFPWSINAGYMGLEYVTPK